MARLRTGGGETRDVTNTGSQERLEGSFQANGGSGVAVDTTTFRSGSASLSFTAVGSNTTLGKWNFTGAIGTDYYARAYVRLPTVPTGGISSTRYRLLAIYTSGGAGYAISLKADDGKWQLCGHGGSSDIGSPSASAPSANTWYRLELRVRSSASSNADIVEARIDGVTLASTTTGGDMTAGAPGQINFGWIIGAPAGTVVYVDDIALNDSSGGAQNSWPGDGSVVLLLPTSNNSVGNWNSGTGTAETNDGNQWDAINNTPPVGTATPNATTAAISNDVLGAGGAGNGDFNMTTYSAAGVPSGATINLVQPVIVHGEDISTGTKTGTFKIVSNPDSGTAENVAEGGSSQFGPAAGGAVGTYPSNWVQQFGAVVYAPSVTLGTAPVARITKTDTGNRDADLCFYGILVDFTEPSATTHPLASTSGIAQLNGTATGVRQRPLASTAGASQLNGTATGSPTRPLAATTGVGRLDATATGAPTRRLTATAGISRLDATTTGAALHTLASASGVAQVNTTAAGAALHVLVASTGIARLDTTTAGSVSLILSSAAGVARLDSTATGAATHVLAATGASQLDATTTGAASHVLAAMGAAQLDTTTAGQTSLVFAAVGGAQLDSTASGAITRALAATTGASRLDSTSTGSATHTLVASAGTASATATAAGTLILGVASTAGTSRLDATASGEVVVGGQVHPLAATAAAQLDATAIGASLHTLSSAVGVAQLDTTANGGVIQGGFEVLASSAGIAQLDATTDGVGAYSLSAVGASQLNAITAGSLAVSLSASAPAITQSTATGTLLLALAATASSRLDTVTAGGLVHAIAATSVSQLAATVEGRLLLGLLATAPSRLDATATGSFDYGLTATGPSVLSALSAGGAMLSLFGVPLPAVLDAMTSDEAQPYIHPALQAGGTPMAVTAAGGPAVTYAASNTLPTFKAGG